MTREFKITANDITGVGDGDCYLDPSDPAFQYSENLLQKYKPVVDSEEPIESWEARYAREHNIKPGTPAWHALKQQR